MGKASQVTVSITKQVRQYEPVRIEVTIDADEGEDSQSLIDQAFEEISIAFDKRWGL